MYALIDISNQMLEDSAFGMEGEIRGEATEQFAVKEGAEIRGAVAGGAVGRSWGRCWFMRYCPHQLLTPRSSADPLRQPRLAARLRWSILRRTAKRARLRGRLSSNVEFADLELRMNRRRVLMALVASPILHTSMARWWALLK